MKTLNLDDLYKNLGVAKKEIPAEIEKKIKEDSEYLKLKIYEEFDNVSKTPIYGYYLEGSGNVAKEHTRVLTNAKYYKKWQKPNIPDATISNKGALLKIIGMDAFLLEYGLSPITTPALAKEFMWIKDWEQGYYDARNSTGQGNWWEAINIATGNEDPLVSYGDKGGRFFAHHSYPTSFVKKACEKYEKQLKTDSASVHLSPNGLKVMIEKELNK